MPTKKYIRHRMAEGCLNARVILVEIREKGYTGSSTILRIFMQPLRPSIQSKATERFETAPGEQAQVDWGHFKVDYDGKSLRHKHPFYAQVRFSFAGHSQGERITAVYGVMTAISGIAVTMLKTISAMPTCLIVTF
ncbi:transposase and inactivated derivative [Paenibacillus popilliae ATCC 14706]|uniref:Transposase and inactivated derivative n=1 Tax=Paenibacillus popilliae ATCC 14706 TaxID=1212764 RepID=M9LIC2_PAEPP|nr:transposase and inactivated derivative [Paenibacillus popilliae ATCC 14706]